MKEKLSINLTQKELENFIRLVFPYMIELTYNEWIECSRMEIEEREKFIFEKSIKLGINPKIVLKHSNLVNFNPLYSSK